MGADRDPTADAKPVTRCRATTCSGPRNPRTQRSPFFALGADDSDDFWSNLDERNAQHRQQLRWLIVAFVIVRSLALVIHTAMFVFALALPDPVTVELFMIRRTRSRVKIPDYRPQQPAEIDLESDR
ncbi:MAG: hypothetical protein R2705_21110 [Ilumatobacteraceae bacterium]